MHFIFCQTVTSLSLIHPRPDPSEVRSAPPLVSLSLSVCLFTRCGVGADRLHRQLCRRGGGGEESRQSRNRSSSRRRRRRRRRRQCQSELSVHGLHRETHHQRGGSYNNLPLKFSEKEELRFMLLVLSLAAHDIRSTVRRSKVADVELQQTVMWRKTDELMNSLTHF